MKRATSQTIVYEFTREEVADALCEKFGLTLPEPSDGWHTLELDGEAKLTLQFSPRLLPNKAGTTDQTNEGR